MPARQATIRSLTAAVAIHALVASVSPFLLNALSAASRLLAAKPSDAFDALGDLTVYFQYASRMVAGSLPYRDFIVEYPLLFPPLAALPRLFASGFAGYTVVFVLEMLAFDALLMWLLIRSTDKVTASLVWYTAFFIALFPAVLYRYDLAPTTLAFAAVLAWKNGQAVRGGVLAGSGALLKLFPALVAAPAIVHDFARKQGRPLRGALALVLTGALGLAVWNAMPGSGLAHFVAYHGGRGIELGSLWAGLSMVLAKCAGLAIECSYDHASYSIVTSWSTALAAATLPFQTAAVALLAWRFHRTGGRDLMRYAAATLLAFILFGKVLSPQYLVWLMPFLAVLEDRRLARWLFLAAALLTTAVFPVFWSAIAGFDSVAVVLLNVRNLTLLVLLFLLLREGS
jgi:hypothetical protein